MLIDPLGLDLLLSIINGTDGHLSQLEPLGHIGQPDLLILVREVRPLEFTGFVDLVDGGLFGAFAALFARLLGAGLVQFVVFVLCFRIGYSIFLSKTNHIYRTFNSLKAKNLDLLEIKMSFGGGACLARRLRTMDGRTNGNEK